IARTAGRGVDAPPRGAGHPHERRQRLSRQALGGLPRAARAGAQRARGAPGAARVVRGRDRAGRRAADLRRAGGARALVRLAAARRGRRAAEARAMSGPAAPVLIAEPQLIVARYGELWLKGRNRAHFAKILKRNTRITLRSFADVRLE